MAIDTRFADRIVNLSIAGGVVRIDFGTIETTTENGERKQRVEVTQRIAMPIDGFVRSFGFQQRLMNEIGERLRQASPQQAAAPAAPAAAPDA